jgi:hypothetical protein
LGIIIGCFVAAAIHSYGSAAEFSASRVKKGRHRREVGESHELLIVVPSNCNTKQLYKKMREVERILTKKRDGRD